MHEAKVVIHKKVHFYIEIKTVLVRKKCTMNINSFFNGIGTITELIHSMQQNMANILHTIYHESDNLKPYLLYHGFMSKEITFLHSFDHITDYFDLET